MNEILRKRLEQLIAEAEALPVAIDMFDPNFSAHSAARYFRDILRYLDHPGMQEALKQAWNRGDFHLPPLEALRALNAPKGAVRNRLILCGMGLA